MINRLLILTCAAFLVTAPVCYALEDDDDGPIGQPCESQDCKDNDAGYKYAQEHKVKEARECSAGRTEAFLSGCEDWIDEQEDSNMTSDDDSDHSHLPSSEDANDLH